MIDRSVVKEHGNEEGMVTGVEDEVRFVGCLVTRALGDAYGKSPLTELKSSVTTLATD